MDLTPARQLCRELWNPIGTRMKSGSQDDKPYWLPENEYDPYLAGASRMIAEGASPNEVINYLTVVETRYLGLSNPKGNKSEFVRRLIAVETAKQNPNTR